MIRILILLCLVASSTFAWAEEANVTEQKKWVLDIRGGFLTEPADGQIRSDWKHHTAESPKVSLGAFMRLNGRSFIYFMFGSLVTYLKSIDKIDSNSAKSEISTTAWQGYLAGVIAFQPESWRGFGLTAQLYLELLNEGKTTLKTDSYSRKLTGDHNNDRGMAYALTAFYELDERWKPFVSLETSDAVMLGVNYAF